MTSGMIPHAARFAQMVGEEPYIPHPQPYLYYFFCKKEMKYLVYKINYSIFAQEKEEISRRMPAQTDRGLSRFYFRKLSLRHKPIYYIL